MEIRVLRYFLAVARERNITGAANYLHLTQPTLSRQIHDLEKELGQQLLIRKDVKGIIFSLQNNYGYTERREVDFGPQASRALTASAVPMAEREALLRELFQEFSQEGAAPDGAGET